MAKSKKPIEQYDHKGKKRVNNPPVGLVTRYRQSDRREDLHPTYALITLLWSPLVAITISKLGKLVIMTSM